MAKQVVSANARTGGRTLSSRERSTPELSPRLVIPLAALLVLGGGELGLADERVGRWAGEIYQFHVADGLDRWQKDAIVAAADAEAGEVAEAQDWVRDAAGSVNREWSAGRLSVKTREPGPTGRLVGYSGLEGDRDSALASARRAASAQIAGLLLCSLPPGQQRRGALDLDAISRWLLDAVGEEIEALQRDVHVELVDRSYGRLYRAAVLVDLSGDAAERLAAVSRARVEEEYAALSRARTHWLVALAIAGALTFGVIAAAGALNSFTKGYYSGRLFVLSLLALGVIWFFFVAVAA